MLHTSRAHNQHAYISGLLLYGEEDILQVLEGPREAVQTLYAVIARDARHHELLILANSSISQRAFAGWSMGFAWFSPFLRSLLTGSLGQPTSCPVLPNDPSQWPELTALLREFAAGQQIALT